MVFLENKNSNNQVLFICNFYELIKKMKLATITKIFGSIEIIMGVIDRENNNLNNINIKYKFFC